VTPEARAADRTSRFKAKGNRTCKTTKSSVTDSYGSGDLLGALGGGAEGSGGGFIEGGFLSGFGGKGLLPSKDRLCGSPAGCVTVWGVVTAVWGGGVATGGLKTGFDILLGGFFGMCFSSLVGSQGKVRVGRVSV